MRAVYSSPTLSQKYKITHLAPAAGSLTNTAHTCHPCHGSPSAPFHRHAPPPTGHPHPPGVHVSAIIGNPASFPLSRHNSLLFRSDHFLERLAGRSNVFASCRQYMVTIEIAICICLEPRTSSEALYRAAHGTGGRLPNYHTNLPIYLPTNLHTYLPIYQLTN